MSEDVKQKLYNHCKDFVINNEISCEETIYQCDYLIESYMELVADVCKTIGYFDNEGGLIATSEDER